VCLKQFIARMPIFVKERLWFMSVTVHLIAAARPNFMKVAPLYHALKATDFHMGVGSGSHAKQTGNVMIAY